MRLIFWRPRLFLGNITHSALIESYSQWFVTLRGFQMNLRHFPSTHKVRPHAALFLFCFLSEFFFFLVIVNEYKKIQVLISRLCW